MKKIVATLLTFSFTLTMNAQPARTIFITGGDFSVPFIKYVIGLTHKANPRICLIPTASADNPNNIANWYEQCAELPLRPYVLRTFINSRPGQSTFEEIIMSMDAIIVGGGSTLNMIAVWKAQGIDTVLRKAYEKGIVMAGGSAGSLCWFLGGITDSRPKQLTLVDCLGFIKTSHCPHYHSEPGRKPLYQQEILRGQLPAGYACDDRAGILFQNEKPIRSVAADKDSRTFFVSVADGKIKEEELPIEPLP
ncbi:MAG TPA: peptidase E [Puia sp.]|nr:peptidase E [Puia sp.]